VSWILDVPLVPVSQNSKDWRQWWTKHEITQEWARAVFVLAKEAKIPALNGAELEALIYFPDRRRRDLDNFFAPLWKGAQDGLVDAGVFPDDNSAVVRPGVPTFALDKAYPHTEITIIPR